MFIPSLATRLLSCTKAWGGGGEEEAGDKEAEEEEPGDKATLYPPHTAAAAHSCSHTQLQPHTYLVYQMMSYL